MRAAGSIMAIFFGNFDLRPLSRADFLPQALRVFFVRQPVAMAVAYLAVRFFESPNTAELFQWLFVGIALISTLCFLIPYFTLMYKRLKGSILPLSRLIFCVLIVLYLFLPNIGRSLGEELIISIILGGGIYLSLFLLSDKAYKHFRT